MEMKEVESSNIKKIGYGDQKLRVEFSGGGIYEYDDVPAEVFDGFLKADSNCYDCGERFFSPFDKLYISVKGACYTCDEDELLAKNIFKILEEG